MLHGISVHRWRASIGGAHGQEAWESEDIARICSAYDRRSSARGKGCPTPVLGPSEPKTACCCAHPARMLVGEGVVHMPGHAPSTCMVFNLVTLGTLHMRARRI